VFILGMLGVASERFSSFVSRHMIFLKISLGIVFVFLGGFLLLYGI